MLCEIQSKVLARDYRYTLHASERLTERHYSVRDVEDALLSTDAEVIEDYNQDPRGASCLILGFTPDGQPMHSVLTPLLCR